MKIFIIFFILTTLLVTSGWLIAQQETSFQYISPKPGSEFLSRETNIILGHAELIDKNSLNINNLVQVTGSVSGKHTGELILSDDNKTVLFNPASPFAPGETVTVTVNQGISTIDNNVIKTFEFNFTITSLESPIILDPVERLGLGYTMDDLHSMQSQTNVPSLDTIPPDFPEITIGTIDNPAPGNIFLANMLFGGTNTDGLFIMALNDSGYPVDYKRMDLFPGADFKVQPNGTLSHADIFQFFAGYSIGQFKILDTTLTVIDSIQCGNGYLSDLHDIILLPNGHVLIFAYDAQSIDMSEIVVGGDPNAIVIGGVIQELDAARNVVFQWRSWDYIPITDTYADLLLSMIDYVHLNAIEIDNDGNILFIGRTLSEVTKISRSTGEIIWRLGGKQNDFTFINEHPENAPDYFALPHNIKRLANGNITLFDNGDYHSPPYSRGVEYQLDEQSKTATMVWEYDHSKEIYAFAMGSVQRLPNGNTLIGWGSASSVGDPVLTEVHSDNSIAFELFFPLELASYRAYKFPWKSGLPSASVTITEVLQGNTYTFNNATDTTGVRIKFNFINSLLYNAVTVKKYQYGPENPEFAGRTPQIITSRIFAQPSGIDSLVVDIYFQLQYYPEITDPANTIVYNRPLEGSGVFIPLATTYNAGTNELRVFSVPRLGEFIFGYPDVSVVPVAPMLVSPKNSQIVNQNFSLGLIWSSRGFTDKHHLQVSTDPGFASMVVDDSTLIELIYTLLSLLPNQDYYWRAKSKNMAGWSSWSDVWSFTSSPSFLDLAFPDGSEVWKTDTSMAIQWDHNLMDSVKVELYKNNVFYSVIVDSMFSITGGYKWWALDSIPDGSDYKVKVSTLDESFEDMSAGNFTIIYIPVGIEEIEEIATDFRLEQNYPNPFNPATTIKYSIPLLSHVKINVYNSIGEKVADLVNQPQGSGVYQVYWDAGNVASGIYFYSIEAIPTDGTEYFHSVKKMILLK